VQALQAAGCKATITTAISSTVPAGDVITQNPSAPQMGMTVALVVSSGPPTCPDVVNETEATALQNLKAAGCGATETFQNTYPNGPYGVVISESPVGARTGTTVALVVGVNGALT
jgi:beta-lactam-binding protein with PASTA domain